MTSAKSLTAGELAVKLTLNSTAFYKSLRNIEKNIDKIQEKFDALKNSMAQSQVQGGAVSAAAPPITVVQSSAELQAIVAKLGDLSTAMDGYAKQQTAYAESINKLIQAYQDSVVAANAANAANQKAANTAQAAKNATIGVADANDQAAESSKKAASAADGAASSNTDAAVSAKKAADAAKAQELSAISLLLKQADLEESNGNWAESIKLTEEALERAQAVSNNDIQALTIEKKLVDRRADSEIQLAQAMGKRSEVDEDLTTQSKRRATVENTLLNAETLRVSEERKKAASIADGAAQLQRYIELENRLNAALQNTKAGVRARKTAQDELNALAKARANQPKLAANAALEQAREQAMKLAKESKDLEGAIQVLNKALSDPNAAQATRARLNETARLMNSLKRELAGVSATAKTAGVNMSDVEARKALSDAKIAETQMDYSAALEKVNQALKIANTSQGVRNRLLERQAELMEKVPFPQALSYQSNPTLRRQETELQATMNTVRKDIAGASSNTAVKVLTDSYKMLNSQLQTTKNSMGALASTSTTVAQAERLLAITARQTAEAQLKQQVNNLKGAQGWFAIRTEINKTREAIAKYKGTAGASSITSALNEVQKAAGRTNVGLSVLRGVIGGVVGGFTAFSIISTVTRVMTEFATASVTAANALEVTSYSAKLVARDTKTYINLLKLARDNQKLFGGTLNENIGNLTGFTLVARTAGVDLKELVGVAQRLSMFDPVQGISGASTALREFLAGNIRSLRERFELPQQVLDKLSDATLTVQERLAALSGFLDSQGLSMENLSGKMDLTAQAYQNFAIAAETTATRFGSSVANFFAPVTQGIADMMDRMNNDADQLARDYYNLSSSAILSTEQYQKGVELAAENTMELIRSMRLRLEITEQLARAEIDLRNAESQPIFEQPEWAAPGPDLQEARNRVEELSAEIQKQNDAIDPFISNMLDKTHELLKVSPELANTLIASFKEFEQSDKGQEAINNLTNDVVKLHDELIRIPTEIRESAAQIEAAFILDDKGLINFRKQIEEIQRNAPKLTMELWNLVNSLQTNTLTTGQFEVALNSLLNRSREVADATAAADGEYKSLNMQFIENEIRTHQTERAQRLLVKAMDDATRSAKLSGSQIIILANLLGVEERKVQAVVNQWRELQNARTLGTDIADQIANIEASSLPQSVKESSIASLYDRFYADLDFELTASDLEKLAKAQDEYNKALAKHGNSVYNTEVAAAYEKFKRLQVQATRSGGSASVGVTGDYTEDMKNIINDYHMDTLKAEKTYQQKLLDIQKEFLRKQEQALRESEISKRRTRGSVYEDIGNSGLSAADQQQLSSVYEEGHKKAMDMIQAGNIEQGTAYLEKVAQNIRDDIRFMQNINEAIASGDTAKADWWRSLWQYEKDARDIEVRQILEDGDQNVNDYNAAREEAESEQIQRLDDINLKYAERAQKLLETEPKVAQALNDTNSELADQAQFLQDLANYTSPLSQGLDGVATAADTALDEVSKLVNYMRNNKIGGFFVDGVSQGISEGESDVVDSAKGVVDSAINGAQQELDARSPSRRTRKELGIPFVQGIISGIKTSSNVLNDTIAAVVDRSVATARTRLNELPEGIRKTEATIDAFKDIAQTNISILQGLRGLLPDRGGTAEGRAEYIAAIGKIDQDTEAKIIERRQKLARDVLKARTEDERRILEAVAQQDIALLQQQANIEKAAQEEQLRNVADQEGIDAKMSAIQASAAEKLKALQERMAELAKTNPEEAARRYQLQAQRILEVAGLRQELERYLMENNLTADDAYASLLRQQIQQVNALANMELKGVGVGNAAINNTVYNINMDLTGSNLRREDVRTIVRQELDKALSSSRGSTA